MMKRRILPLLLSVMLVVSLSAQTVLGANYSDIDSSWAKEAIQKWTDKGVLRGYADGSFRPKDEISRAELAQIISVAMRYIDKAENTFVDVPNDAWFAEPVLKLNHAGILLGLPGGQAAPNSKITREDAALMIARAFQVPLNAAEADAFTDAAEIGTWAKGAVGGLKAAAYVKGYEDGSFQPKNSISREETVQILDNVISALHNEAGAYDAETDGNAVINVSDVVLNDGTIAGDLYIAEGIGDGSLTLNNVTVAGKVYVRGGGENSIHINGQSVIDEMIVAKTGDNPVRICIAESATVTSIRVNGGKDGVIIEGSAQNLTVSSAVEVTLLSGTVSALDVTADGAALTVKQAATVTSLNIDAGAAVNMEGAAENINVSDDGAELTVAQSASLTSLNIGADATVNVAGSVSEIRVTATCTSLNIAQTATVTSLNIDAGAVVQIGGYAAHVNLFAIGAEIVVHDNAIVDSITIRGANNSIRGGGHVGPVIVESGEGHSVTTAGTEVTVAEEAGEVSIGGGAHIQPGETGTVSADGTAGEMV